MKITHKTQLNQGTFHNLQSHLAKLSTLIRHTICESLMIQYTSDMNVRQLRVTDYNRQQQTHRHFLSVL